MRIAIIDDWLDTWEGGEHCLARTVALFLQAYLIAQGDFFPAELGARTRGHARMTFLPWLRACASVLANSCHLRMPSKVYTSQAST